MKCFMITLCAGMLLFMSPGGRGAGIVSTVSSATDDVVVLISATINVSVSPRGGLAAGTVAGNTDLGTYSVSVSDSLLAVRVNRAINPAIDGMSGEAAYGQASNQNDTTKKLNFMLTLPSGSAVTASSDGWQVMAQGVMSLNSLPVRTYLTQEIAPGRYPLAIDAAVYAF